MINFLFICHFSNHFRNLLILRMLFCYNYNSKKRRGDSNGFISYSNISDFSGPPYHNGDELSMRRTCKMTLVFFLFVLTAILGIFCVIFSLSTFFCVSVVILDVVSVILVLKLAYCPHCGKLGIRIQPFSKHEPRCKKCGKIP